MALYVAYLSDASIRLIAQEYLANDFSTMKFLAQNCNTSPRTISNILFKGVTERILDDVTAEAVAYKAINSTDNVSRTRNRWKRALAIRNIPRYETELEFMKNKLNELNFQLETFEDYFACEADAPTKECLHYQIKKLTEDITSLENYITELRGKL